MKILMIGTLAAMMMSCSSTPHQQSTFQYLDNSAISAKVKTKLVGKTGLNAGRIDVESYKGTVILSGFVDSEDTKEKAIELASNTKGVKEVKDALYVRSEISEEMED